MALKALWNEAGVAARFVCAYSMLSVTVDDCCAVPLIPVTVIV
jgi:hypothetical protein